MIYRYRSHIQEIRKQLHEQSLYHENYKGCYERLNKRIQGGDWRNRKGFAGLIIEMFDDDERIRKSVNSDGETVYNSDDCDMYYRIDANGWNLTKHSIMSGFYMYANVTRSLLKSLAPYVYKEMQVIAAEEAAIKAEKERQAIIDKRTGFNNSRLVTYSKWTNDGGYIFVVGPYAMKAVEEVSEDWEAYSKAWHRTHGPKKTVDRRYIIVNKGGKLYKEIDLNSWAGDWQYRVLRDVLSLQVVRVSTDLRKVQLKPCFGVRKAIKRNGVQYYHITAGHYDIALCGVDTATGMEYHADTIEEVNTGLSRKLEAVKVEEQKLDKTYTAIELHERFGFCNAGMRDFADACNIDFNGTYSVRQLIAATQEAKDKNILRKYRTELKTINVIK
jgi:predicted transcriptional regulator with HTH domain